MSSLLVAGATGAVGRTVVLHALRDARVGAVVALTRATGARVSDYATLFGLHIVNNNSSNNSSDSSTRGDDDGVSNSSHSNNSSSNKGRSDDEAPAVTQAQLQKLRVVSFDWERFATTWAKRHRATALAQRSSSSSSSSGSTDDEWAYYKGVFGGHACAAMCLGTTRRDAGSAAAFVRCDYDYAIAFVEALLTFSAPAGLAKAAGGAAAATAATTTITPAHNEDDGFVQHIGDGARNGGGGGVAAGKDSSVAAAAAATPRDSSCTLRALCCVSAMNASASSLLLYPRTKGCVEAALVERVRAHNAAGNGAAVSLSILRPGLLHRGGQTRLVERLARVVLPALPVDTCGRCIVSTLLQNSNSGASDDVVVYTNREIKEAAARLS